MEALEAIEHIDMDTTEIIGDIDFYPCRRCGEAVEITKYSGYHFCNHCGKEYLVHRPGGQVTISFNKDQEGKSKRRPIRSPKRSTNLLQGTSEYQSFLPEMDSNKVGRRSIFIGWFLINLTASIAAFTYHGAYSPLARSLVAFGWAFYIYILFSSMEESLGHAREDASPLQKYLSAVFEARLGSKSLNLFLLLGAAGVSIVAFVNSGPYAPFVWSFLVVAWVLYAYIMVRRHV
jgi:hypothetical protein